MTGRYNFARLRVLVVDDNEHMRRLLRSILGALGFGDIRESDAVADAFESLKLSPPDFVIADWHMKPIDGLEFIRMVRLGADSPNPYLPIIMLTGHTELRRVIEARDAGANEVMAKPISARALYARILSIIEEPRPFVRTADYFGPDRRRRDVGPPPGVAERRSDPPGGPPDDSDIVEI